MKGEGGLESRERTCKPNAVSPQTCREDLGDEDPGHWSPGCRVTNDIEINHGDHGDRSRADP